MESPQILDMTSTCLFQMCMQISYIFPKEKVENETCVTKFSLENIGLSKFFAHNIEMSWSSMHLNILSFTHIYIFKKILEKLL